MTAEGMKKEYDFSNGVRGKYSAEKAVRDAWEAVCAANTYYPGTAWTIFIYNPLVNGERTTLKAITGLTKHEAWQAALDFTRKRKQEIAEMEEEIAWMTRVGNEGFNVKAELFTWQRILSRLTAQRDELRKGMRAEIGGEK